MTFDGLTPDGLDIPRAKDFLDEIQESIEERLDEDIDFTRNDFFGAITVEMAVQLGDLAQALKAVQESRSPAEAEGVFFDDIMAFAGLTRDAPTPSTLAHLRLDGDINTPVPSGTVVVGGGEDDDARWETTEDRRLGIELDITSAGVGNWDIEFEIPSGTSVTTVTYSAGAGDDEADVAAGIRDTVKSSGVINGAIDARVVDVEVAGVADRVVLTAKKGQDFDILLTVPGGGSASFGIGRNYVAIVAQEDGPTIAEPGRIDRVDDPIDGLDLVTNEKPAVPGSFQEPVTEARKRREESLQFPGSSAANAVLASVLDFDFVDSATVLENDTNSEITTSGFTLPPHSMAVVVWPNSLTDEQTDDIALSIYRRSPAGIEIAEDAGFTVVSKSVERADGETKDVPFHYATEVEVDVTMVLNVASPLTPSDVAADITSKLSAYFADLKVGEDIRRLSLYGLIDEVEAVQEVVILTLNGSSIDLTLGATEIATLDETVVS